MDVITLFLCKIPPPTVISCSTVDEGRDVLPVPIPKVANLVVWCPIGWSDQGSPGYQIDKSVESKSCGP